MSKTPNHITEIKEYLVSLIGNSPTGLIGIHSDGTITFINTKAFLYLGLPGSINSHTDKHLDVMLSSIPVVQQALRKNFIKSTQSFDVLEVKHNNLYLNFRGRPVLNGMQITVEDVTDRVMALRSAKKSAKELKQANEELKELTKLAAHDLKSPLVTLLGLVNMQKKVQDTGNKLKFASLLNRIQGKVNEMFDKVQALNAIMEVRSSPAQSAQLVDVKVLVLDIFNNLQESYINKEASLTFKLEGSVTLKAFPDDLQSLFVHLLDNSFRFSKPEENLIIHIEMNKGVLKVTDNGLGFDAEASKSRLFKPYQRFHPTISGTGVGLYLAKLGAQRLGYSLSVESQEAKGTTYTIQLD